MKNSIIGKITSIIGGVPRDILHVQQRLVMQQAISRSGSRVSKGGMRNLNHIASYTNVHNNWR